MTELAGEGDTIVAGLSFHVLGPVQVHDGDTAINVGGPAPRLVLVQLLFNPNRVVSTDALVDALWGDDPPPTARRSLQAHVAKLRAALGGEGGPLRPQAPGYVLSVDESQIDLCRSERLVRRARAMLESDPREAQRLARLAQREWTGEPLGDLAQHDQLLAQRRRLDQLWLDLAELSLDAQLAVGETTSAVERLESLVIDRPEHEPFWARLMTGYYRLGRQSDALAAFQRARTALLDGFGIDPSPTLQRLETAILSQSADLDIAEPDPCPYKGLASYQLDDAENFYGRDYLVAELLEAVRTASLVVVVGSSGAGKSSALRAGLVNAVGTSRLNVCRQACVITPGSAPLRAIYQVPTSADLIVVDQFEELFTLTDDETTRTEFVRLLLARIHDHSDRVVISLRADFYGYCTRIADLAPLLARRQVVVGPLNEHELRAVIAKPAEAAGLVVDEELVDTIVGEAAGHAGALPLVSHALVETWHRRTDGHLRLDAYRDAGSIAAAIARTAERAYNGFQPEQRAQAERLFMRLVEPGEGTESSRRKVSYAQLEGSSIDRRVIDLLVDARLLTAEADGIEIAHEALIGAWPRLTEWIDDGRDGMRMHRHLTSAASAWEEVGRDEEELYRGARLSGTLTWIGDAAPDLSNLERDFVDASLALSERRIRQQVRTNRRLRVLVALSLVGVIIAAIGIVLAVNKTNDAERGRAEAEAARIVTTVRNAPDLPDSAVLQLAVEADRRASTPETQGLLLDAIAKDPAFSFRDDLGMLPMGNTPVSSNGGVIAGTDDNVLGVVLDTATLKPLKQGLQPAPLVVVNTGSRLLGVIGGADLKVVDLNTRATVGRIPGVTARASEVGLSRDGTLLAVATKAGSNGAPAGVTVYDVDSGRTDVALTSVDGDAVTNVLFGPDSGHVLAVVGGSRVALWDSISGMQLPLSVQPGAPVTRLGMSPSGKLIAIGRENGELELFESESGLWRAREITSSHRDAIAWIDFDADGERMVSTSRDGVAIVWDTATGLPVSRPRHCTGCRGLAAFFQSGSSTGLVTIADGRAYE
ncbi:MAG TPA: BTAD domain-containing putative transcriptional regulator, partial [Ilumatobacteraceae bacterium]|nr:BTAD domain-containing putative transcriptional regulator [Ilumatobacteraceae bacterium]